jgi:hypothetical protein
MATVCKVTAHVFWNKDGILLADYMRRDATTPTKYYVAVLKAKLQLVSNSGNKQ